MRKMIKYMMVGFLFLMFACSDSEDAPPPPKKSVKMKIEMEVKNLKEREAKTAPKKLINEAKATAQSVEDSMNKRTGDPARVAPSDQAKAPTPPKDSMESLSDFTKSVAGKQPAVTKPPAVSKPLAAKPSKTKPRKPSTAKKPGKSGFSFNPFSFFMKDDSNKLDLSKKYDPKGKIDPFDPLIKDNPVAKKAAVKRGSSKKAKEKRVRETAIEMVDLSQFSLKAIIQVGDETKAMVEESSGKGYMVKVGTYIGNNYGQIKKIEGDAVFVEEETEDALGNIKIVTRILKLQKKPGE